MLTGAGLKVEAFLDKNCICWHFIKTSFIKKHFPSELQTFSSSQRHFSLNVVGSSIHFPKLFLTRESTNSKAYFLFLSRVQCQSHFFSLGNVLSWVMTCSRAFCHSSCLTIVPGFLTKLNSPPMLSCRCVNDINLRIEFLMMLINEELNCNCKLKVICICKIKGYFQ